MAVPPPPPEPVGKGIIIVGLLVGAVVGAFVALLSVGYLNPTRTTAAEDPPTVNSSWTVFSMGSGTCNAVALRGNGEMEPAIVGKVLAGSVHIGQELDGDMTGLGKRKVTSAGDGSTITFKVLYHSSTTVDANNEIGTVLCRGTTIRS